MFAASAQALRRRPRVFLGVARRRLLALLKPAPGTLVGRTLADLTRSKPELVAENALLRQQLVVLKRAVKRPRCTPTDRTLLVLLAGRVRTWRPALLLVQPDTLLRWHRDLFRQVWRRRSRPGPATRTSKTPPETVALIREMAAANRLWGAERIRGERLKRGIRVGKRTVQRHLRAARPPQPLGQGQAWATFLRHHAGDIWAGDFLPIADLLFRPVYACFVIALGSRRVVHHGVTRHPTDAWVAQQLHEATPFGVAPRFLIRDNDGKYGPAFACVARGSRIAVLRPAAPRGRTPPVSASWAASGARASTMCWSSASGSCPGCSASTLPTSTGRARTRAWGRRSRSRRQGSRCVVRDRYARCPSSEGSAISTSAPPEADR